jgi:hypothetical protein
MIGNPCGRVIDVQVISSRERRKKRAKTLVKSWNRHSRSPLEPVTRVAAVRPGINRTT